MKSWFFAVVDILLPPRCVVTGDIVDRQGMIDPSVWGRLNFIAEPYCDICGKPFDFDAGPNLQNDTDHESGRRSAETAVCVACLQHRPVYDAGRSALLYDDASRDVILRFKHADQLHVAPTLAKWLVRCGRSFLETADFLAPVPLHRFRLIKRRYNQAALLAQAVEKEVGVPCVPDMLLRTRSTPSQGIMTYAERRKNVQGAFIVNPRHSDRLAGTSVVLIDDVYTSGSTISECGKALRECGVERIYSLTAARVSGTDYFR